MIIKMEKQHIIILKIRFFRLPNQINVEL
uniref:Uncharacterized protein n=1 Tax=Arundo donax TaxID=35708 RepID=A0A0A9GZZ3_ARUDO